MKKTSTAFCGLILGLLTFVAGTFTASATITIYTDRVSWTAAVGGAGVVDDMNSGTLDRGTYAVTGTAQNFFPNGNATTTIDSTGYLRVLLGDQGEPDSFSLFTFDNPTFGFGYDINPHHSLSSGAVFIAADGVAAGSYSLGSDVTQFRGFVSDVAFTTFEIRNNDTSAWHGIDNLQIANAVPEPSCVLLGIVGITAFGFRRWRK